MEPITDFDRALIAAAFDLAAMDGWRRVSVPAAARHGALAFDEARARFAGRDAILLRFGRMADLAALAGATGGSGAASRDTLFDIVMRRIDVLQAHRAGVLALFRALPGEPLTALMLAEASRRGMAWLLEAAGIETAGLHGALRVKGMLAVWLWTVRAWSRDESPDLTATLAALDRALDRAEQAERSWPGRRRFRPESATPVAEADSGVGAANVAEAEPLPLQPAPESGGPPLPPIVQPADVPPPAT